MAAKTLLCASRHDFKLDNARPLYQAEHFGRQVQWDDTFVSEMKRGLIACRVMSEHPPKATMRAQADRVGFLLDFPSSSSTFATTKSLRILFPKPAKCNLSASPTT